MVSHLLLNSNRSKHLHGTCLGNCQFFLHILSSHPLKNFLHWTEHPPHQASSNRFFFCKQFSQFNTFLLWKILVGIRLRMATFPNTVADGRSSGKALEKSNFSQTCSLLSKFLKEKRGSGDSVSGMGGKMDPKGTMIIFVSFFLVCYMKLKKKKLLYLKLGLKIADGGVVCDGNFSLYERFVSKLAKIRWDFETKCFFCYGYSSPACGKPLH